MAMDENITCEEHCEVHCEDKHEPNLGLAFGLTILAGLATTVGAMLLFIPVIRRANTVILSAGLALAAGVMLYVSFTAILEESTESFHHSSASKHSKLATASCFFGGVLLTVLLDLLTTWLQKLDCGWKWPWCRKQRESFMSSFKRWYSNGDVAIQMERNDVERVSVDGSTAKEGGDSSSSVDSEKQQEDKVMEDGVPAKCAASSDGSLRQDALDLEITNVEDNLKKESEDAPGPMEFKDASEMLKKDAKRLNKMGLLTALAIGLHNIPEGMAALVATLSSPSLGIALAIAIALHNVPEGLCVALPIYYATGNRWKGLLWAFLSGISEPIGALLGWAILKDILGPAVFGVVFGLIAGMMVFISFKELLPMAYKFDSKQGRIVTFFLTLGMFVMALSLVLLSYLGSHDH